MTIQDVIARFNTIPILFAGSGITRRYYDLPDWKGLLTEFASRINADRFAYRAYESKAQQLGFTQGIMPKIATLIQQDFDSKWYSIPEMRTNESFVLNAVENGCSPFKAEIAWYLKEKSVPQAAFKEEIQKLKSISKKNLAGVITTNYDTFFEKLFDDYTPYIGQDQLVFSSIQGIAEVYKIHGSVTLPNSLVLNEKDYEIFNEKSKYLAAKLMTIFMEYPIIFMGYSISDTNIQKIIKSIIDCLDIQQLKILEDRFIFVEYQPGKIGSEVTPYTIMIDDKPLAMKKIVVEDFKLIYKALEGKKSKLPVRILRRFKQELYDFTVTNMPTASMRVASIEDDRVKDEEFVMAIGKYSDYGLRGLHGLKADEWYRNIVIQDIEFSADDLLKYAFNDLMKQNSGRLPVNKYLSEASDKYPECIELARKQNFDYIISATIKKNRNKLGDYKSVMQIWKNEKTSVERATNLIAHLKEEDINVDELESVLKEIFENDVNVLQNSKSAVRTNVRRLIMIYDYLKWGNKRTS